MGISGNLQTMVLPELLQWLSMGQKSGTLVIDSGEFEKKIFFEEGAIISSASTDPKEYLGCFLASHGFLPEEKIEEALARQKSQKQLLGQILVDMGAIAEEDLSQMLRIKTEESIYDIFTWEQGDFEFFDDELPKESMIRMSLDVQGLVLEGTRRLDEWCRIREHVPSPRCVPVSIIDLQTLELEEMDLRILEWIDDDRTIEEISQGAQTSLFHVANTIALQVSEGNVKAIRPRTIEVKVPVEVPVETHTQPTTADAARARASAPAEMPAAAGAVADPIALGSGRRLTFAGGPAATDASSTGVVPVQTPPAPAVSVAGSLVQEAEVLLKKGDLEKALETFRLAGAASNNDSTVEGAIEAGLRKVQQALERDGIDLKTVPKLECAMDELTQVSISPQEGFMLTRVDGSYNLKSILQMSPMPPIDAQMLFWRLKKLGHVSV